MASAGPGYWLAAVPAITYDLPGMREARHSPSQRLARPVIRIGLITASPMVALLSLLLVFQPIARFVIPSVAALDPLHEHLIIGGDAQMARTGLGWHQHSVLGPHSHPITGSVFEPLGQERAQVISYTSNVATELSSYFGMMVIELLAPIGGIPAVPLLLLLPLGLAAMAFTLGPGQAPPAPPPKRLAR